MDRSLPLRSRLHFITSGFIQGRHYRLPGAPASIAYTYIRKNACSAFKRFILRDIHQHPELHALTDIMQMSQIARLRTLREFRGARYRIFVYRDPLQRIASLYTNKFVQQKDCDDLFRRYQRDVGQDPQQASFIDFIIRYIERPYWFGLDPHVLPQFLHLAPVPYTHAIPVNALHTTMRSLLGESLADAYFQRPHNSTSQFDTYDDDTAPQQTAATLHRIFRNTGAVPAADSLLNDFTRRRLQARYRCDTQLLQTLSHHAEPDANEENPLTQ